MAAAVEPIRVTRWAVSLPTETGEGLFPLEVPGETQRYQERWTHLRVWRDERNDRMILAGLFASFDRRPTQGALCGYAILFAMPEFAESGYVPIEELIELPKPIQKFTGLMQLEALLATVEPVTMAERRTQTKRSVRTTSSHRTVVPKEPEAKAAVVVWRVPEDLRESRLAFGWDVPVGSFTPTGRYEVGYRPGYLETARDAALEYAHDLAPGDLMAVRDPLDDDALLGSFVLTEGQWVKMSGPVDFVAPYWRLDYDLRTDVGVYLERMCRDEARHWFVRLAAEHLAEAVSPAFRPATLIGSGEALAEHPSLTGEVPKGALTYRERAGQATDTEAALMVLEAVKHTPLYRPWRRACMVAHLLAPGTAVRKTAPVLAARTQASLF